MTIFDNIAGQSMGANFQPFGTNKFSYTSYDEKCDNLVSFFDINNILAIFLPFQPIYPFFDLTANPHP